MSGLANVYMSQGRYDKAEPLRLQRVDIEKRRDATSVEYARALSTLATNLLLQKKFTEAERYGHECVALHQQQFPYSVQLFNAKSLLGGVLAGQEQFTEAEPILLEAYTGLKQRAKWISTRNMHRLTGSLERLIDLYNAWEKPDKAAKWRAEMVELKRELGIVERPDEGVRPPGPTIKTVSN